MAFRQHQRPQPARQLSLISSELSAQATPLRSTQRKRSIDDTEEWVLFSPAAPSGTNTHSDSARTLRTAGLSHLSDIDSLDTAARSGPNDDNITYHGSELEEAEELDSLDDGLHAFHEPSEYAGPSNQMHQSGNTVLPTHDGLGTFQASAEMQEHLWQFEQQPRRPRAMRRRSSVQRRLDALEEAEELNQEQDRRLRIEKWRMEQSKALLEEIERETRRRRRMSVISAKSRADSLGQTPQGASTVASVSDGQSEGSDDSTESLSFWERLTRRVIRGLMGIDEDTLSVIFGEALPEEASSATKYAEPLPTVESILQMEDPSEFPVEGWEQRLLERIACELGTIVHQLTEHPGAFSTYLSVQETPAYVGMAATEAIASAPTSIITSLPTSESAQSPTTPFFVPMSFQQTTLPNDTSLWGIEEESNPLDSFTTEPRQTPTPAHPTEEQAREREYWEQELDVKMVFNFLMKRFSSTRRKSTPSAPSQSRRPSMTRSSSSNDAISARRAAVIRQHHPLVNRNTGNLPTSSSTAATHAARESRRKDLLHRHHAHHFHSAGVAVGPAWGSQALRSSSSCASQNTKKSRKSAAGAGAGAVSGAGSTKAAAAGGGRNFWDLSGSVGSGSVVAAEG